MRLSRRSALAAAAITPLAACSSASEPTSADHTPKDKPVARLTYGDDPSQWADLYHPDLSGPDGTSRGVVVVIHGGFWKALYDASLGTPLAEDLVARGWTVLNVEYRRVGNGGGTPQTFDDVAAAIDVLAEVDDLDLTTVVTLGHSAGGHLAVWAAGRESPRVAVTHAISQAGVLDLVMSERMGLGGGAAAALLGHDPGPDDAQWDPQQQIPLDVPVWCVHGVDDAIVPLAQSEGYVVDAVAAGAQAEIVRVPGDHFVVIDPSSEAWTSIVEILDSIA
jgi:acetyl esterase/lipase